jgi:hypothetical protein
MTCERRKELLKLYHQAATEYADMVRQLKENRGIVRTHDYMLLRSQVINARVKLEQIRLDLGRHASEHGC